MGSAAALRHWQSWQAWARGAVSCAGVHEGTQELVTERVGTVDTRAVPELRLWGEEGLQGAGDPKVSPAQHQAASMPQTPPQTPHLCLTAARSSGCA